MANSTSARDGPPGRARPAPVGDVLVPSRSSHRPWTRIHDLHAKPRLLATCLLLAVGCAQEPPEPPPPTATTTLSTADWPGIVERGSIRLARRAWTGFDTLPSQGLSTEEYHRLAERFARDHDLAVEWVLAADMDELFRHLEEGRADIAVSNITVTDAREQRVSFSLPLTRSREWVIGFDEDRGFGIADHTAYLESLARHYPDAQRIPVATGTDPIGFQALLEEGAFGATIMDEAAARVVVATSERVEKLRELPEVLDHAWALRRGNAALKEALDAYLLKRHTVDDHVDEIRDWDRIVATGRLRMLTVNQPTTYYLWRGELLGFEYELIHAFAEANDLELEVVVASDLGELFEWLALGRGDVIAASLVRTDEREAMGMRFTRPYLRIRETFVTAGAPVLDLAGLSGRRVTVNPVTSYAVTLKGLVADADFDLDYAELSTTGVLEAVVAGDIDVTLVDGHRAALEATFEPRLSLGLGLEPEKGLRWAVAADNSELWRRLDAYVADNYRGYDFNVLYRKYFVNERRMARQQEHRVTGDALSPFDAIVKPLAEEAGLDWRLVVAQMYQESGFDPDRVSFAGAMGLLQVLPSTAAELGIDAARLADPEVGIAAGVDYLAWTRARFPDLPIGEQLWFALGAYNAGAGHVRDGRRLAGRLGLDGSLWFDNVERAMLKLAEPEYARDSVYGYVRGTEVTRYVREIRDRYGAYVGHFDRLGRTGERDGDAVNDSLPPPAGGT